MTTVPVPALRSDHALLSTYGTDGEIDAREELVRRFLPQVVGVSQMQVSRLIRRSLDRVRAVANPRAADQAAA